MVGYDQLDPKRSGGSIDFWRLDQSGDAPRLVKMRASVATPHGPHSIVLAR